MVVEAPSREPFAGPPSYRQLLAVESFPRLIAGMLLGRVGGQMVSLILVLFVLARHGSPELAGIVTFVGIAPGLVVSPVAGALLDRHGRTRLMVLDYLVAAAALALVAGLSAADRLPVPLLLAIVAVGSLTQPLSTIGVRTLFPLLVPRSLWERANAIDSTGYVVSGVAGPALAGALVALFGGEGALLVTAGVYALAALATAGLRDPATPGEQIGGLLARAWAGIVYVARHPTLRSLALVVSTGNVAQGLFYLALPVLVLQRMGHGPEVVGWLFALMGLTGFVSVLLFGRVRTAGRERALFAGSMLGGAAALLAILLRPDLPTIALAMAVIGVAGGPYDVTLFTLRQRRTDPAWLGRAFAVSMYLNFAGFPLGAALGGVLAAASPAVAFAVALVFLVAALGLLFATLPSRERDVP